MTRFGVEDVRTCHPLMRRWSARRRLFTALEDRNIGDDRDHDQGALMSEIDTKAIAATRLCFFTICHRNHEHPMMS